MSRRRRLEPPELDPDPDEDDELDEEDVEYFVDVLDSDSVRTSVPKSVQLSQSSSSAPSTFVVVSDDFSAPHISHWGMTTPNPLPQINHVPTDRSRADVGGVTRF
jgi:hypothetical protein